MNQFYEDILSDSYTRLSEDPGKTEAVYNEMEADLAVLLQKYLSLTKEETDSMRGLTKSRRTVMIEQASCRRLKLRRRRISNGKIYK